MAGIVKTPEGGDTHFQTCPECKARFVVTVRGFWTLNGEHTPGGRKSIKSSL